MGTVGFVPNLTIRVYGVLLGFGVVVKVQAIGADLMGAFSIGHDMGAIGFVPAVGVGIFYIWLAVYLVGYRDLLALCFRL